MSEKHILAALSFLIVGLVIFAPSGAFKLREFIRGTQPNPNDFEAEVAVLKMELARRNIIESQSSSSKDKLVAGEVYSRYPFGLKNEFLLNVGEENGIKKGQPALFKGIFVGWITKIFDKSSLIQTLFDVRTKLAVRIGNQGADGLLVGGNEPRITLITKDFNVAKGDVVYLAAPALPFGIPLGELKDTPKDSEDNLFKEALLYLPYEFGSIRVLQIMSDYVPPGFF